MRFVRLSHRKIKVGSMQLRSRQSDPGFANAEQTIAMDLAFEGLIRFVGWEQYRHLELVNGDITRMPFRDELADTLSVHRLSSTCESRHETANDSRVAACFVARRMSCA